MEYNNNDVANPKDDRTDIDKQSVSDNSFDNLLDNVFGDKMANMPKPLEETDDYTKLPETYSINETNTSDTTVPYRYEQYYTPRITDSCRTEESYTEDTSIFYGYENATYCPCSYFCPYSTVPYPTTSELSRDINYATNSLYRADGLLPLSLVTSGLLSNPAYYPYYDSYNPYYNYTPYYNYSTPYGFYPWQSYGSLGRDDIYEE